jgi:hypothetical protein
VPSFRGQGPLCATTAPPSDAGTMCRGRTPAPGVLGHGPNGLSLQTKTKVPNPVSPTEASGGGGLLTAANMIGSMVLAGAPEQSKPDQKKPGQTKPKSTSLSFEYEPMRKDLIPYLTAGNGFTPVSPFFAVRPGCYAVHGNSEISIRDSDRNNVASQYDTYRQYRGWDLTVAGPGYTAIGEVDNWKLDSKGSGPNWKDVPGGKFADTPPNWNEGRSLLEFFVAVDGHPEIGSLYFFVVVSLKPGHYRVEMSSALFSPPKDGDPIPLKNTSQPWAQESGCGIKLDSGWLKAPAGIQ